MAQDGGVYFQPVSATQQELQRYYTTRLCEMRDQLSPVLKAMLSDTSISELAAALMDGTVFEITKELEEIQQLNERSLLGKRMKIVGTHKNRRMEMSRRHRDETTACETKPHNLPLVTAKHKKEKEELEIRLKEELHVADEKIVGELDQIVTEQQSTLHEAAVPFFIVTDDPKQTQLQMHLLDFIQKLTPANK